MRQPGSRGAEAEAAAWAEAEEFNRRFTVGETVNVKRDDGSVELRCIRSEAWALSSGHAVVSVQGITGGYLCERITKAEEL